MAGYGLQVTGYVWTERRGSWNIILDWKQDWRLFSPTLPENVVQGAAEPNTQMSAYPIFDKFGKLSGEKKNLEIGQDLTVLNQKHILLLHTQYLEDSTAPPLN